MSISNINLPVTVTPFPPGTCFQTDQDLANAIGAALQVTFPGTITPWNIGPNQPSVNDRDKPWLKTDAVTNTIIAIGIWSPFYGLWVQSHWQYNGNTAPLNERRLYVGSLSNLEAYDGGSAGTVSPVTGPFWVVDSAFNSMMPYGANVGSSGIATPILTPLITSTFDTIGTAADPKAIGVYFIMPSGRLFDVLA